MKALCSQTSERSITMLNIGAVIECLIQSLFGMIGRPTGNVCGKVVHTSFRACVFHCVSAIKSGLVGA